MKYIRLVLLILIPGALSLLIGASSFIQLFKADSNWQFQVIAASETTCEARVYFRYNKGFREIDSSAAIVVGDGVLRAYHFSLPNQPLREIRFDPFLSEGKMFIESISITDRRGRPMYAFDLGNWRPINQIATWDQKESGFSLFTEEGASDPYLIYGLPEVIRPPLLSWFLLFEIILSLLSATVAFLLIRWLLGKTLASYRNWPSAVIGWWKATLQLLPVSKQQPSRLFLLAASACLMLCILGTRWWMVGAFSSDMPYWDQWDSDGMRVLIPYFEEGGISREHWFAPHNEHRVFFTRATAFALFLASGQWDARVQAMFNAFLPSIAAVFIFYHFSALLNRRRQIWVLWAGLMLLFCLPYSWENTVGAFQNQFFFLILFSIAAIWLLPRSIIGSPRWLLGMTAALAGVFTMAPGILAAAAGGGMSLLVAILSKLRPLQFVSALITFALCLGIGLWGISIIPEIPYHSGFRASNFLELTGAALVNLAWPLSAHFWLAPLLWLPFIVFGFLYLTKRLPDDRRMDLLFGLGAWVILFCLSAAYSRGGGMPLPISRYTDPLSYIVVVNLLSLLVLSRRNAWVPHSRDLHDSPSTKTIGYKLAGTFYALIVLPFLMMDSAHALGKELPQYRSRLAVMEANTRHYVATGDFSVWEAGVYYTSPHPNPYLIKLILDVPAVREVLPASVRAPVSLEIETQRYSGFKIDGIPQSILRDPREIFWGSFDHEAQHNPDLPWRPKSFQASFIPEKPFSYVFFEKAGFFNTLRRSLYFISADSGAYTVEQRGVRTVDTFSVYKRLPRGERIIMAASGDNRHMEWVGFSAPRLMSGLSYRSLQLSRTAPLIGFAGLAGAWLLFIYSGKYRSEHDTV